MSVAYLDRLAARSASTGTVLCLGLDPDPSGLPDGFSPDLAGLERFAALVARGGRAVRGGGQAQPGLLRGVWLGRVRGAGAAAGEPASRCPAHRRRKARRHRDDGGPSGGRAVRRPGRGRRHGQSVPRRRRRSTPLLERLDRFAYLLCRTSNPGAGELQDLVVARGPGRGAPPPSRCTCASPASRRAGDRAARSVSSWARPQPRRSPRSGPLPPVSPSSCPASERRAGPSIRCWRTVRPQPPRPAVDQAAACSSTSRGASLERPRTGLRETPSNASQRLPPTGLDASLCYPSRRPPAVSGAI